MALPNLQAGPNATRTIGDILGGYEDDDNYEYEAAFGPLNELFQVLSEPIDGVYPVSVIFWDWEGGGELVDIQNRFPWGMKLADLVYFANSSDVLKRALSKLSPIAQQELGIIVPPGLAAAPAARGGIQVIQPGPNSKETLYELVRRNRDTAGNAFLTAMITPINGVQPARKLPSALEIHTLDMSPRWKADHFITALEVNHLLYEGTFAQMGYFIETLNSDTAQYAEIIQAIISLPQDVRETLDFWVTTRQPQRLPKITLNYTPVQDIGRALNYKPADFEEFYRIMGTPINGIIPEKLVTFYNISIVPTDADFQRNPQGRWVTFTTVNSHKLMMMANKNPIIWRALAAMSDETLRQLGLVFPATGRAIAGQLGPAVVQPQRPVSPLLLPPAVTVTVPQPTVPLPTVVIPRPTVLPPVVAVPPPTIAIPRPTVVLPPPTVAIPRPTVLLPPTTVGIPRPTVLLPPPTVVIPPPTVGIPRPTVAVPPPTVGIPPPTVRPPTFVIPPPTVKAPPPTVTAYPTLFVPPTPGAVPAPVAVPLPGAAPAPTVVVPTRVALAPATFDPATLTREYVLSVALADPIFRTALQQLKTAQGFEPQSITVLDDHGVGLDEDYFAVDDVLVVVRFDRDGTPTAPNPKAVAQDGYTSLPAWITYGHSPWTGVGPWGLGIKNKNPLYVGTDNIVHFSKMADGISLSPDEWDPNFNRIVADERGVYVQDRGTARNTKQYYEANVLLTIPELAALI